MRGSLVFVLLFFVVSVSFIFLDVCCFCLFCFRLIGLTGHALGDY